MLWESSSLVGGFIVREARYCATIYTVVRLVYTHLIGLSVLFMPFRYSTRHGHEAMREETATVLTHSLLT